MKFLIPLVIATITGVSAVTTAATPTVSPVPVPIPEGGDKDCLANYIVKQCLQTESDKLASCSAKDYECQCYASQAIATCYNNCPNDSRAPAATASMNQACSNASIYATTTKGKVSSTVAPKITTSSDAPNPTDVPTNSVTFSADTPTKTNGVDAFAGNAAGMLAAVAGAVVAVL